VRLWAPVLLCGLLLFWWARSCGADSPEAILEGTVRDPLGHGVEGVTLRASFEGHGNSGYRHYAGFETARTDWAGRFSLEIPSRAAWATIWIDAPGWVRPATRTAGPSVYDVLGRQVGWARQEIVLERGRPIDGVVETEAGVPVPDVPVEANWGDRRSVCRTDERGRFSIVVPVDAILVARAHRGDLVSRDEVPGFPWETRREPAEPLARDAEAWAGPLAPGTSGVRMVLRDNVALRLRVQGPDGAISGLVLVRVTDLAWKELGSFTCGPSVGEGGLVEIRRLMPGRYAVEVLPRSGEWLPATVLATLPAEPVDVRCAGALRIDCALEGEDLKDFEVTWTGACNEGLNSAQQQARTIHVDSPTFALRGIGAGAGDLYARRAGDPRFAFVPGVRPGRGVVRLKLSKGWTIRGQVDAPAGPTRPSLTVRAAAGLIEQRAPVGEDGAFSIVGLPPGRFRVELVTGAWTDSWSRRGGRVTGGWAVRWLHDAKDDVAAGATDIRLRARMPAGDLGDGG